MSHLKLWHVSSFASCVSVSVFHSLLYTSVTDIISSSLFYFSQYTHLITLLIHMRDFHSSVSASSTQLPQFGGCATSSKHPSSFLGSSHAYVMNSLSPCKFFNSVILPPFGIPLLSVLPSMSLITSCLVMIYITSNVLYIPHNSCTCAIIFIVGGYGNYFTNMPVYFTLFHQIFACTTLTSLYVEIRPRQQLHVCVRQTYPQKSSGMCFKNCCKVSLLKISIDHP